MNRSLSLSLSLSLSTVEHQFLFFYGRSLTSCTLGFYRRRLVSQRRMKKVPLRGGVKQRDIYAEETVQIVLT